MASTIPASAQQPQSNGETLAKTEEESPYTLEGLQAHKTRESFWMLLHDKVYDVSKFLDEVRSRCAWRVIGSRRWEIRRDRGIGRYGCGRGGPGRWTFGLDWIANGRGMDERAPADYSTPEATRLCWKRLVRAVPVCHAPNRAKSPSSPTRSPLGHAWLTMSGMSMR